MHMYFRGEVQIGVTERRALILFNELEASMSSVSRDTLRLMAKVVRPYAKNMNEKFNPLDATLGPCGRRAGKEAVIDWFTTELIDARMVTWIGSGDAYTELLKLVSDALLAEFTLPEELKLSDELTYLVTHTNASLRGLSFMIDWVIEPITNPSVVEDIVLLDKARRNTKGKQGILEKIGMAAASSDCLLTLKAAPTAVRCAVLLCRVGPWCHHVAE